jgi:nucleolar protein 12
VEREGKSSIRAAVILKKFKKDADSQHCYILFETPEQAQAALGANGTKFQELHIRVNMAAVKEEDFESTIFVGNLPFNITEEAFRAHFAVCGPIRNIRVIRDPYTHQGKGIGYVYFEDVTSFQKALKLNNSKIGDRQIRVKKAVRPERLAKKERKRAEIRASKSKEGSGDKSNLRKRKAKSIDRKGERSKTPQPRKEKHREESA